MKSKLALSRAPLTLLVKVAWPLHWPFLFQLIGVITLTWKSKNRFKFDWMWYWIDELNWVICSGVTLLIVLIPDMLYLAPELLRESPDDFNIGLGSQAGDIYAFAIIMQEISMKDIPYAIERRRKPLNGRIDLFSKSSNQNTVEPPTTREFHNRHLFEIVTDSRKLCDNYDVVEHTYLDMYVYADESSSFIVLPWKCSWWIDFILHYLLLNQVFDLLNPVYY